MKSQHMKLLATHTSSTDVTHAPVGAPSSIGRCRICISAMQVFAAHSGIRSSPVGQSPFACRVLNRDPNRAAELQGATAQ